MGIYVTFRSFFIWLDETYGQGKSSKRIVEQEVVAPMGTRTHSVQSVDVLAWTYSGTALERSLKCVPPFLSEDTQYRGYIS